MTDDRHTEFATESDAVREHAIAVGSEDTEAAWILSPYDTWSPNPFYSGPKVPHPEEECWIYMEDYPLPEPFEDPHVLISDHMDWV